MNSLGWNYTLGEEAIKAAGEAGAPRITDIIGYSPGAVPRNGSTPPATNETEPTPFFSGQMVKRLAIGAGILVAVVVGYRLISGAKQRRLDEASE